MRRTAVSRVTVRRFLERPRQVAARKWVFQAHVYVGLLLGLYFVVVCATGSALVFRPEAERALVPGSPLGSEGARPRPFQAAWQNVRAPP